MPAMEVGRQFFAAISGRFCRVLRYDNFYNIFFLRLQPILLGFHLAWQMHGLT